MTARTAALLCLLGLSVAAAAADHYDDLFKEALQSVDFEFARDWAYTETSIDSEHVWVGRYDPRLPRGKRWELISVDNRAPTDDDIEEYLDDRDDDFADDDANEVVTMVEPDSVKLKEETDQYWLLSFNLDEDEKAVTENVDATIRINKPGRYLEYVDVHSRDVIKPAFGVKLTRLVTRLTFGPAVDAGPIVPLSTQVEVSGRAFLFISFDEQELSRNSDFEYAGDDR